MCIKKWNNVLAVGNGYFMEKYGVIKIGCFGEFLTWGGVHKIKLSVRKKAGYRTINSKISVILK